VSTRHTRSLFGVLLVMVFAFSAIIAAPASAKLTKHQKVQIRKQLKRAIKKNPKLIRSKHFIKKASLVNFKLPVTIRLRDGDIPGTSLVNESATRNPNRATIDLGASLGQREVNLGGSLAAEITFSDSYDGGALGNVKLDILPSATKSLTSTSIPLLWNTQVSNPATRWDANALLYSIPPLSAAVGCGNFTGGPNLPFGAPYLAANGGPGPGPGAPGFPLHLAGDPSDPSLGSAGLPEGFLPVTPGVDDINSLTPSKQPGNPFALGGNPSPFPSGSTPGGFAQPPSVKDTVLRTTPLNLTIATAGTAVNQSSNVNGVAGSQDITIGKSGGEANLFGNIPGKGYGIDVTVSLATKINSIFRIVDQDSFGTNLVEGDPYPAGVFNCRQVYSGAVQNYIPSVHLTGSLKISPGITSDGHLRIAKATIATPINGGTPDKARFAVSACLMPFASFEAPQNGSDTVGNSPLPTPSGGLTPPGQLPVDVTAVRPTPSTALCNDDPTGLVKTSALPVSTVNSLAPAAPGNGYTVTNSGSAVSVAADLQVNAVDVDVLIGDTP
jgi:hypothetical protein